ncbi:hypothetical protein [Cryobacterium sp. TMS1-13-1]|uniref:hypothetical protein n=1 Tax=Cryobacterium sp. TMS1-13-1 TaxID=1259220 RepID=UPI00106DA0C4|nr:hypothetical protein [Cryobacterium sp. TMS1-13-1]TFD19199.1 hypothetical protein E3T31_16590 [Cryobacterium sp. TMS1-13-1]
MAHQDIRYRIAAILMIVHGGLMELGAFLAIIPLIAFGIDITTTGRYFSFNVSFFQEHLIEMMLLSGIFGITRIIGAVGVLRNRLWGLVLACLNSVVTMTLMVFMLPAGIVDGILACSALILLLTTYFGKAYIVPPVDRVV